jgi:hypothetical protein
MTPGNGGIATRAAADERPVNQIIGIRTRTALTLMNLSTWAYALHVTAHAVA